MVSVDRWIVMEMNAVREESSRQNTARPQAHVSAIHGVRRPAFCPPTDDYISAMFRRDHRAPE